MILDDHYGLPARDGIGDGCEMAESTEVYPPGLSKEQAMEQRICQTYSTALVLRSLCRTIPISEESRAMLGAVVDELHDLREAAFSDNSQ